VKLTRPKQRSAPETIIALIDVVFFLLVFFMLIGRMDATAPFEVMPPLGQSGSPMPGAGSTISVSDDGALALDGAPVTRTALLDEMERVIATEPERLVRINAHRAARLRDVLPLAGALEGLGAREVVLVLTPAEP
jgi:biopolymer transport protein ExbD